MTVFNKLRAPIIVVSISAIFSSVLTATCLYRTKPQKMADTELSFYAAKTEEEAREKMDKAVKYLSGGSSNFFDNLGFALDYYRANPKNIWLIIACDDNIKYRPADQLIDAFALQVKSSHAGSYNEAILFGTDITPKMAKQINIIELIKDLRKAYINNTSHELTVNNIPLKIDVFKLSGYNFVDDPLAAPFPFDNDDPEAFKQFVNQAKEVSSMRDNLARLKQVYRTAYGEFEKDNRLYFEKLSKKLESQHRLLKLHIMELEKLLKSNKSMGDEHKKVKALHVKLDRFYSLYYEPLLAKLITVSKKTTKDQMRDISSMLTKLRNLILGISNINPEKTRKKSSDLTHLFKSLNSAIDAHRALVKSEADMFSLLSKIANYK